MLESNEHAGIGLDSSEPASAVNKWQLHCVNGEGREREARTHMLAQTMLLNAPDGLSIV
jgi:hypothetical protein